MDSLTRRGKAALQNTRTRLQDMTANNTTFVLRHVSIRRRLFEQAHIDRTLSQLMFVIQLNGLLCMSQRVAVPLLSCHRLGYLVVARHACIDSLFR